MHNICIYLFLICVFAAQTQLYVYLLLTFAMDVRMRKYSKDKYLDTNVGTYPHQVEDLPTNCRDQPSQNDHFPPTPG